MKSLYKVYLVNKETEEVQEFTVLAGSETSANIRAVLRAGIQEVALEDWVVFAEEIGDMPCDCDD